MKEKQTEETLRSFFERNTNLFTVLVIFNALAIYSSQMASIEYSEMLVFLFTMLSLAVLWPILIDSPDDDYDDDNGFRGIKIKFMLLRFGLVMTQFGFAMNTLKNFPGMISIVITLSLLFSILPLMVNFAIKKIDPLFRKSKIKLVRILLTIGYYSNKIFLFFYRKLRNIAYKDSILICPDRSHIHNS